MRKFIAIASLCISMSATGATQVAFPTLNVARITLQDEGESTDPDRMLGELNYWSSASFDELLAFYVANPFVSNCKKNETAENYHCKLAKHGRVLFGDLFISEKPTAGQIEVYVSYVFRK